ncbi:STAS-like domain-containing protein [Pseudoalteromonas sp. NZS11]|uniref:STAS-like domain-containing protein n=1 Tax=Pseudoalteromonas sp. NZS11 TaxID=2792049 RepID=UPI0018CF7986|nr:DUF4325 domain-containing protein [Pseudoalteromonas sp. NZS11]MBH0078341.1 DUF4325 domain-containing protein [Pseudoalteromonas sp. NZS11]
MSEGIMEYKINLAKDFSEFPFGRYKDTDGEFTGEAFREDHLRPILIKIKSEDTLLIDLADVAIGIGSSFLNESFAGAVKKGYIDKESFLKILKIKCDDDLYEKEIKEYIIDATMNKNARS